MSGVFKLILAALGPIIVSIAFDRLLKKTKFKNVPYMLQQVIIGVVFGGLAIVATETSITIADAGVNIRDASILCSGLIFGGPAGIIAGLIGGIERFLAAYWSGLTYTKWACSIAAVLAGAAGHLLKRHLFDGKRPNYIYGFFIGISVEVMHMLLVFITNMSDIPKAFSVVKACAPIMIPVNSVVVALSLGIIGLINKERVVFGKGEKRLAPAFQAALMVSVVLAFLAMALSLYALQTNVTSSTLLDTMELCVNDAKESMEGSVNIWNIARHSRINKTGSLIIIDSDGDIASQRSEYTGTTIQDTGLEITALDGSLFTSQFYGTECYCMAQSQNQYTIVAVVPVSEANLSKNVSIHTSVYLLVIVFFAMFINIYFLIKSMVVDKLDRVNGSLDKIAQGELNENVNVHGNVEFSELSKDINQTVGVLKHYISEAEARMDAELEVARQIQCSALPNADNPYPDRYEFDIYASMDAAKEVGGDFYDFYLSSDGKIALLIADVSGKGVPAAMFMMRAKTLIKGFVESGLDAAEALTRTNKALCEGNDAGMFITAWLGIVDLRSGQLNFANAGHNPPVIKQNGEFKYLEGKVNFVLAGMDCVKYALQTTQLTHDDEIFLYTDGVTEANNINKELYGEDRLLRTITWNKELSCKDLVQFVRKSVDEFAGEADQFDDITMLCFKLKCIRNHKLIYLNPNQESLEISSKFIDRRLENYGADSKLVNKVKIAMDEIYSNIVYYSGASDACIEYLDKDDHIVLVFKDNGTPFNPLDQSTPDITLSAEERRIGGLGIFMVKKMASNLIYSYEEGYNILSVEFKKEN